MGDGTKVAFRISADMVLERFAGDALALLAKQDRIIRLNMPATDVLTLISETFGTQSFTEDDLKDQLARQYQLAEDESREAARSTIALCLEHGIAVSVT
jgi:hypothetical protein